MVCKLHRAEMMKDSPCVWICPHCVIERSSEQDKFGPVYGAGKRPMTPTQDLHLWHRRQRA
jgi:hypothetical protein